MDKEAHYQVRISGELPQNWFQLEARMEAVVGIAENGQATTTLSGKLDQAALMGLLRRLYSLGLPLLSVECVDFKFSADKNG